MFLWTETFPLKDWGDWVLIGCSQNGTKEDKNQRRTKTNSK